MGTLWMFCDSAWSSDSESGSGFTRVQSSPATFAISLIRLWVLRAWDLMEAGIVSSVALQYRVRVVSSGRRSNTSRVPACSVNSRASVRSICPGSRSDSGIPKSHNSITTANAPSRSGLSNPLSPPWRRSPMTQWAISKDPPMVSKK